jgi:hypothetical protein
MMSASVECKKRGFTLIAMSRVYGKKLEGGSDRPVCGVNTLREYYKNKPTVFQALIEYADRFINDINEVEESQ